MSEDELISKLKVAVRDAAVQQISMNRHYRKDSEDHGFYHYEANFKAILYTKLVTEQGMGFEDVSLERRLVVTDSSTGRKRFDMVIDNNDEQRQYAVEVKLLKRRRGLEKWISSKKKFTIYQDLKKLSDVMDEREPDRWETMGIMVVA